ncbi:DnaJ domain-containing protein [Flagelloscypha sp. PMI_526]|nr:DnaJ domain-containing protein [Flagelloscypha sp. PMI_526]
MDSQNYYALLGLDPNANEAQICKAYKDMALRTHPDKSSRAKSRASASTENFQHVLEAFRVLIDPIQRAEYDRTHVFSRSDYQSSSQDRTKQKARKSAPKAWHHSPPEFNFTDDPPPEASAETNHDRKGSDGLFWFSDENIPDFDPWPRQDSKKTAEAFSFSLQDTDISEEEQIGGGDGPFTFSANPFQAETLADFRQTFGSMDHLSTLPSYTPLSEYEKTTYK